MDLIQAANRSMRCFVFGLLSFIPVLGLAMAAIAWIHGCSVSRGRGKEWNPALPYLRWGRVLGLVGAFASSALFILLLAAIQSGAFSMNSCSSGYG
jgi:hypothetical protein